MKKKIGISFSEANFQNYWNWFTPEDLQNDLGLVELSFQKNNTEDIYQCDGFVLTGGVDVDPSFYEGPADYKNGPEAFHPERDRFEEKIYQYSQQKKLPLLGICRGMQLINVLEGGKLIQDLDAGNKKHKKEEADKEHAVTTGEGSLLYQVTGNTAGSVNSAHHQAIDPNALGKNLKASAYADNGEMIEGLEFSDKTNKGFMLCVQWHPERIKDREENPFSKKLKEKFLEEIRK